MELDVTSDDIADLLKNILGNNEFDEIRSITSTDIPAVVYTSFDGDKVSHSELMKQYILKKGLIPLNPESALGTYLVTNHYKGDKGPIIEDCLSLIELVDEFYVMSSLMPAGEHEIKNLPEGVIAEILYWVEGKDKPVTYVDIAQYTLEKEIFHTNNLLYHLNEKQMAGIEKAVHENRNLRPVAYLLSGEMHAKHSDWMRKDAYNSTRVPLCPYTLINYGTLKLAFGDNFIQHYMSRAALGLRANEIRLYGPQEEQCFELSRLPDDALVELYILLRLQPKKSILYKSFASIGVPKYANRKKWAITDFEREQAE